MHNERAEVLSRSVSSICRCVEPWLIVSCAMAAAGIRQLDCDVRMAEEAEVNVLVPPVVNAVNALQVVIATGWVREADQSLPTVSAVAVPMECTAAVTESVAAGDRPKGPMRKRRSKRFERA